MTKAFVTGGTGFLGGRLIAMLVQRGWQVRALHRSPADATTLRELGAEPVQGALDSVAQLEKGIGDAAVVFHAAALFKLWGKPADFEKANVEGTRNVLAAAQELALVRNKDPRDLDKLDPSDELFELWQLVCNPADYPKLRATRQEVQALWKRANHPPR